MNQDPLAKEYFNWLYDQVFVTRDILSMNSYTLVCDKMNQVNFLALVPHDENRIAEGAALRNEFLKIRNPGPLEQIDVLFPDATVFEVLVALAGRASFMIQKSMHDWFWIFVCNLDLARFNDQYVQARSVRKIDRAIDTFNNRKYRPDGDGGIFPLLRHPLKDQRHVELWYQMAAYMTENQMY